MGAVAGFKCDVPTQELLDTLSSAPLPLGLSGGPAVRTFHRDVYFDTPDGALHRRGVTCRFRLRLDDRRFLTVRILGNVGNELVPVSPLTFDAEVPEVDLLEALAGASEPARRLRALIDPGRLKPRVELETERRVRIARAGWFSRSRFEIAYDLVTVHRGGLTRTFQELDVRRLRPGPPSLERLAQAFEEQFGLRPILSGKLERAEQLLRALESEALARAVRGSREVAVLALEQGLLALRCEGGALKLPVVEGSGEEACRHLLRTCFGSADAQVRLLGTAAAAGTRPILEVWLTQRLPRGLSRAENAGLEWVALAEVMARVGSPVLRDPRTLAALTVAARTDVLPEWRAPAQIARAADAAASPLLPVAAATASERTLAGLRQTRPPAQALDTQHPVPEQFINVELSWLEFNARVLALAEDPATPLLARVRFLSIFSANLDEFFMVRVGALKRALAEGRTERSVDGLDAQEQLDAIAIRLRPLVERQYRCFLEGCVPELAAHGIRILRWPELSEGQQAYLRSYFEQQVFPLLTPQAITRAPGHPFPRLANLRLSLAVVVRDLQTGPVHFAHLKLPEGSPRLVPLPEPHLFVPLEDVMRANLAALYPGRRADEAFGFRVTRSGDIDLDERSAASLLQAVEEEVEQRPFSPAVRVEVERAMPRTVRELLQRELRFEAADQVSTLGAADIYDAPGPLDLGGLREIADLPLADLHYPAFRAAAPLEAGRSLFGALAERDVLVHHPYDAFESTVQRFFEEAADDPAVQAIKLTLYRSGGRSAIVDALVRAAGAGKEVAVFVELKARFDEERNIDWARKLEQAGIHVVYGLVQLKTHAKTALVIRREADGVRRYVHIGTGNYNAATARAYTDLGLLSADQSLGAELNDLFNELTGASRPPQAAYRRLLVAPTHMLGRFLELIGREAEHARSGRGARIRVKVNGLADTEIIAALYRAAQAGVEIELIVRGICALRPGVPGLSERVRVISPLGRFLEHARIFAFANGGDPEYYIGSADWRPRNLRRRVEVVTPVSDPACRARLEHILATEWADPTAWELDADGGYRRRMPAPGSDARSAQERLIELGPGLV